jgi:hypothetical protein
MKAPFGEGGKLGVLPAIFTKKEFWFIVILAGIAVIGFMFLPNILAGMGQALRPITPQIPNASFVPKPTFP